MQEVQNNKANADAMNDAAMLAVSWALGGSAGSWESRIGAEMSAGEIAEGAAVILMGRGGLWAVADAAAGFIDSAKPEQRLRPGHPWTAGIFAREVMRAAWNMEHAEEVQAAEEMYDEAERAAEASDARYWSPGVHPYAAWAAADEALDIARDAWIASALMASRFRAGGLDAEAAEIAAALAV